MFFKIVLLALCAFYVVPHGSASPTDAKLFPPASAPDAQTKNDLCQESFDKEIKVRYRLHRLDYEECDTLSMIAMAEWMDPKSEQSIEDLEQRYNESNAALAACNSVPVLRKRIKCLIYEDTKNKQIQSALGTAVNEHTAKFNEIEDKRINCYTAKDSIHLVQIIEANENKIKCLREPITEVPIAEAPITDTTITEAPITEIIDAPVTGSPITENLITSFTDLPSTTTAAPRTEVPTTPSPLTERPSTPTPTTQASTTPERTKVPKVTKKPGKKSKESKESKEDTDEDTKEDSSESNESSESKESKESKQKGSKKSQESKKKDSKKSKESENKGSKKNDRDEGKKLNKRNSR